MCNASALTVGEGGASAVEMGEAPESFVVKGIAANLAGVGDLVAVGPSVGSVEIGLHEMVPYTVSLVGLVSVPLDYSVMCFEAEVSTVCQVGKRDGFSVGCCRQSVLYTCSGGV